MRFLLLICLPIACGCAGLRRKGHEPWAPPGVLAEAPVARDGDGATATAPPASHVAMQPVAVWTSGAPVLSLQPLPTLAPPIGDVSVVPPPNSYGLPPEPIPGATPLTAGMQPVPGSALSPYDPLFPPPAEAMIDTPEARGFGQRLKAFGWEVVGDYQEFYSLRSLAILSVGFGAGAAMANTGFDEHVIRDAVWEDGLFGPTVTDALHQPKIFGDGRFTITVTTAAALAGPLISHSRIGATTAEWGRNSVRALLVGAPPMLLMQRVTGGSRPGETDHTSHWRPFQDSNGVSGHAFMGAVPFLTAAHMADRIWLKATFYGASTLPAISRVNDDDHYFSQAFLGWWMAFAATEAVHRVNVTNDQLRISAAQVGDGYGMLFDYSY